MCLSCTYFSAMCRTLSIARRASWAGMHSSVGWTPISRRERARLSSNSIDLLWLDWIGWIISASFGGIFGLCLGGSVMSVIELIYLLARQLFKRQLRRRQEQSRARLLPASEVFLTIPAKEKVQLQKLRDHQGSHKRIFVTCFQPAAHHREITNLDETYRKHVKF